MVYDVLIERKANKELLKLDQQSQNRIFEVLKIIRDYGFTQRLDIKKIQGYTGKYRLRVGDYRVLFELSSRTVIVYAVLPRSQAYKRD